jgi:serine/threonine-protein kinase
MRDEENVGRFILGRYRVVLQLGSGGQGAVYLARGEGAEGFARPVVVKRILAPLARDPEMLEQFAREARITAQLRHPSIVSVIDFARDGGSHVMVLEYVHGYDLRRWERYVHRVRGHFAPELVIHPVLRVLDALHYAHTLRGADGSVRRVIHRDISPANVLIDVGGHVKLTDFGIARMADEEITADTTTVRLKGKLPYLAPEMFQGSGPSEQTDLYACGVMLHELLIGKNEFHAASAVESMARVTGHIPTRVDAVRPNLPRGLGNVVAHALAKDPANRFRSAQEFSTALREVFHYDDTQLSEAFGKAVFDDFNDPRCAQVTGSPPLSELDAAWRQAPTDRSLAEHARAAMIEGLSSTGIDPLLLDASTGAHEDASFSYSDSMRPSARRGRTRRNVAVSVGFAVAMAALVATYMSGKQGDGLPRFVYVDKQHVAASASTEGPSQNSQRKSDEPQLAATSGTVVTAQPLEMHKPATSGPSRAELLTRAFAQRHAQVESCFQKHRVAANEQDSMLVQFSIDRAGRVKNVGLVPDRLNATPFGRCVTRIAAGTRFGAQPEPLAFRIPITARRTP